MHSSAAKKQKKTHVIQFSDFRRCSAYECVAFLKSA